MIWTIRICSDAFGIERLPNCNSKEEAITQLINAINSCEELVLEGYPNSSLSYRICIDIGEYDDI